MKKSRASVLILSLWILAFLALFIFGITERLRIDLKLAPLPAESLTLHQNAKEKVLEIFSSLREKMLEKDSFALKQLLLAEGQPDAGGDTLAGTSSRSINPALPHLKLTDEKAAINLNTAPLQILKHLFEEGSSASPAEAIADWRDADNQALPDGAEESYYRSLQNPYHCKNGNLESLEELFLVRGITPAIFKKIKDVVTVYGDGKVNLNTATESVLKALGISRTLIEKIVRFRSGTDGIWGTQDDLVFDSIGGAEEALNHAEHLNVYEAAEFSRLVAQEIFSVNSKILRFKIALHQSHGSSALKVEGVVEIVPAEELQENPKGFKILYWQEE